MKYEKESEILKAIAHPVRLHILELLRDGQKLTVTELFEKLELEQSVVSQHLRILKDRDVVCCDRDGKNRYYFLKHAGMSSVVGKISGCCQ